MLDPRISTIKEEMNMYARRGEGTSVAEWLATAACIVVFMAIAPSIEKRGFKKAAAIVRSLGIIGAWLCAISMYFE